MFLDNLNVVFVSAKKMFCNKKRIIEERKWNALL